MSRLSLDKFLSQFYPTLVLLTCYSRLTVLINTLVAQRENSTSLIPKPDIRHDPEPVRVSPSEPISLDVLQIHHFPVVKLQVSTPLMPRPSKEQTQY